MFAMTFRDRIRAWLGISDAGERLTRYHDDVTALVSDIPSLTMFKAMEAKQAERHNAVLSALTRIEQRMINEHIGVQPREFAPQDLDWDLVQAIALTQLQRNPEKES
jgi:hypothetical protein